MSEQTEMQKLQGFLDAMTPAQAIEILSNVCMITTLNGFDHKKVERALEVVDLQEQKLNSTYESVQNLTQEVITKDAEIAQLKADGVALDDAFREMKDVNANPPA